MNRKKTWDVIIARDVMVPMRDGVNLVADLYFPAEDGRPLGGQTSRRFAANPLQEGKLRKHGEFLRQARLSVGGAGLPRSFQIRGRFFPVSR